jgi:hypothetical protein
VFSNPHIYSFQVVTLCCSLLGFARVCWVYFRSAPLAWLRLPLHNRRRSLPPPQIRVLGGPSSFAQSSSRYAFTSSSPSCLCARSTRLRVSRTGWYESRSIFVFFNCMVQLTFLFFIIADCVFCHLILDSLLQITPRNFWWASYADHYCLPSHGYHCKSLTCIILTPHMTPAQTQIYSWISCLLVAQPMAASTGLDAVVCEQPRPSPGLWLLLQVWWRISLCLDLFCVYSFFVFYSQARKNAGFRDLSDIVNNDEYTGMAVVAVLCRSQCASSHIAAFALNICYCPHCFRLAIAS